MPLSHVPLADLNSSSTFIMTTMTMQDGMGLETERILTTNRGGLNDHPSDDAQDRVIQRYELEDSVQVVEWSAADPWIFAGVSYNGTFFLNHVPSKEKYKILL